MAANKRSRRRQRASSTSMSSSLTLAMHAKHCGRAGIPIHSAAAARSTRHPHFPIATLHLLSFTLSSVPRSDKVARARNLLPAGKRRRLLAAFRPDSPESACNGQEARRCSTTFGLAFRSHATRGKASSRNSLEVQELGDAHDGLAKGTRNKGDVRVPLGRCVTGRACVRKCERGWLACLRVRGCARESATPPLPAKPVSPLDWCTKSGVFPFPFALIDVELRSCDPVPCGRLCKVTLMLSLAPMYPRPHTHATRRRRTDPAAGCCSRAGS